MFAWFFSSPRALAAAFAVMLAAAVGIGIAVTPRVPTFAGGTHLRAAGVCFDRAPATGASVWMEGFEESLRFLSRRQFVIDAPHVREVADPATHVISWSDARAGDAEPWLAATAHVTYRGGPNPLRFDTAINALTCDAYIITVGKRPVDDWHTILAQAERDRGIRFPWECFGAFGLHPAWETAALAGVRAEAEELDIGVEILAAEIELAEPGRGEALYGARYTILRPWGWQTRRTTVIWLFGTVGVPRDALPGEPSAPGCELRPGEPVIWTPI